MARGKLVQQKNLKVATISKYSILNWPGLNHGSMPFANFELHLSEFPLFEIICFELTMAVPLKV